LLLTVLAASTVFIKLTDEDFKNNVGNSPKKCSIRDTEKFISDPGGKKSAGSGSESAKLYQGIHLLIVQVSLIDTILRVQ
jgi:hypothetical protein